MTTARARPAMRLGRRTRKAVLLAHLVAAGAWIGLDVVLAVLVFTAFTSADAATVAVSYQALGLVAVWPMIIAALATLLTGVALGLGTPFGLLRYWWVAVKFGLTVVLAVLVTVALRPGVLVAAEEGRRIAAGADVVPIGDLAFPPIVSSTALLVAFALSVFKPWGRIRR
ncbi:hypothetical protein [Pseudonocardia nigra]|uniref:hypothetical protein n=1 Tax=Pseudonocardia nigra TaxID=1921578 RepID=UPI0027E282BD|nr:hypothetical protein [Pseudonocardia nigra]